MEVKFWNVFRTDLGNCLAVESHKGLSFLNLPTRDARKIATLKTKLSLQPEQKKNSPLLKRVEEQVNAYLSGKRKTFSIPLDPNGTPFQKSVWNALCKIPYGATASYQQIAKAIRKPKALRAVGMANHYNPIPLIIPCHRVIGKDGSLVGFGGGLPLKRTLLHIEKSA